MVLDVLLEEQHVSRAAERLAMSQPAVSRALARSANNAWRPTVSANFGGVCFKFSSANWCVKNLMLPCVTLNGVIEPPDFDPATDDSLIRITGLDMEIGLYIPQLIKRIRREAPNMRFRNRPSRK